MPPSLPTSTADEWAVGSVDRTIKGEHNMVKTTAIRVSQRVRRQAQEAAKVVKAAKVKAEKNTADVERAGARSYSSTGNKKAPDAVVLKERMPIPTKNKQGELVFKDYPDFRPNLTPKEVLHRGSFGGGYFRRIKSAVTGETYSGAYKEFPTDWFKDLNIPREITSAQYRLDVNRYKVKCGGSLDMWESSGWISPIDPYGWFQWYCRFYLGRRSTDDQRQISRGLGVCGKKGRFRNQLIGMCSRTQKRFDDPSVSPVIRQSLQHWGYVLTQNDADKYLRSKKMAPLPR